MPNPTVAEPLPAEITSARRQLAEALRRVNQDYAIFGEPERENVRRLDAARRRMRNLGLTWGILRKLDSEGRPALGIRPVIVTDVQFTDAQFVL